MYYYICTLCNKKHRFPYTKNNKCHRIVEKLREEKQKNCEHLDAEWEASNLWCVNCGRMLD